MKPPLTHTNLIKIVKDGVLKGDIPGSDTLFLVSTRPSKLLGCWHPRRGDEPPEVVIYPANILGAWCSPDWHEGDEASPLATGICVVLLLELICLTRSQEVPRSRRHCKQNPHCPPEKIAFEMMRHVL